MVFRLSKPAKAALCFPKHALICILIITLIIKVAAEVYQSLKILIAVTVGVLGCWGGGGGGGCTCMHNNYSDRPICMDVATSI